MVKRSARLVLENKTAANAYSLTLPLQSNGTNNLKFIYNDNMYKFNNKVDTSSVFMEKAASFSS